MGLQAVSILTVTLAFCSAARLWNVTPNPASLNAAKKLMQQHNLIQGTYPTSGSTQAPGTCYTQQQDAGTCVKTSMCDMAPPKVDPATLIGYRMHPPANGCAFLEICCPSDKMRPAPVPPTTGSGGKAPGCGYTNPAVGRFRDGAAHPNSGYADFAEFPWMVALVAKTQANGGANSGYIGGGTLVHPSIVMTVAHKVDTMNPGELRCRAGEWDTQNDNEMYAHQDRDVSDIILHPQFNKLHAHNDIALLKLATPFVLEPHINVACLSPLMPPSQTMCYSMGWGEDFTKGKYYASVLKKIPLGLIHSVECEERLRGTILGQNYNLHQSLTCAGGEFNVDTCIGDGGSSLVCPTGNPADLRYTVVGMVAYGISCGQAGVPGVYTKVPEFYYWITGQIARAGLSGSPYVLN